MRALRRGTRSSWPPPRSSTRSGRATARDAPGLGEDVGLPPGQMGNSGGRPPDDRAGRVILRTSCASTGRSSREFFESPALTRRSARAGSAAATSTLSRLVSYGGVHSHIDHPGLLELARREEMAERTTSTPSPTAATSRRPRPAATWRSSSPRARGSPPSAAATTRWTATSAGSGPRGRLRRSRPGRRSWPTSVAAIAASYERGVDDEFVEPVVLPEPRLTREDAAIHFNFRPTARDSSRSVSWRRTSRR